MATKSDWDKLNTIIRHQLNRDEIIGITASDYLSIFENKPKPNLNYPLNMPRSYGNPKIVNGIKEMLRLNDAANKPMSVPPIPLALNWGKVTTSTGTTGTSSSEFNEIYDPLTGEMIKVGKKEEKPKPPDMGPDWGTW